MSLLSLSESVVCSGAPMHQWSRVNVSLGWKEGKLAVNCKRTKSHCKHLPRQLELAATWKIFETSSKSAWPKLFKLYEFTEKYNLSLQFLFGTEDGSASQERGLPKQALHCAFGIFDKPAKRDLIQSLQYSAGNSSFIYLRFSLFFEYHQRVVCWVTTDQLSWVLNETYRGIF